MRHYFFICSLNADFDVVSQYSPEINSDSTRTNFLVDNVLSDNLSQLGCKPNYTNDNKDNLKSICTKDLLSWAFQIAHGMEYLSQRKASFNINKCLKF